MPAPKPSSIQPSVDDLRQLRRPVETEEGTLAPIGTIFRIARVIPGTPNRYVLWEVGPEYNGKPPLNRVLVLTFQRLKQHTRPVEKD